MSKLKAFKRFIKISVAFFTFVLIVVLIIYFKNTSDIANSNISSWLHFSDEQKMSVIHTYKEDVDYNIMLACLNKIASLEGSSKMLVKDAASICYNGIKLDLSDADE